MNFNVLVYSGQDGNLCSAVSKLGAFTADGIEDFASVNCDLFDDATVDPKAAIQSGGDAKEVHLLHWLAHNMVTLDTLRVIGVAGGGNSIEILSSIDRAVKKIIEVVKTMSGHLVVEQFRVACPTYSSEIPRESFFSRLAKANLVVIPRDSATHKSIAYPIEVDGSDDMASHISVELSALFGMWKEMQTSVADSFVMQSDIQDVRVQFVSSRISLLECPALPIQNVISNDGDLPLPYQYLPVPDSLHAVEKFAQLIYPDELRFTETEAPLGPYISVDGKKFKGIYLKELIKAFIQLPRALVRGVQEHLETISGEALQQAVGGASSSIEVVFPGSGSKGEGIVFSNKQIEDLIEEIADRNDRPVITTIGEQAWIQIVDKVIAVADGGPAASDIRSTYSNEKFLISRQPALSPDVEDLSLLLHDLYKPTKLFINQNLIEVDESISNVLAVVDEAEGNGSGSVVGSSEDVLLPAIDTMITENDFSKSLVEENSVGTFESKNEVDEVQQVMSENGPEKKDLLGRITQIMLGEGGIARRRAEDMVERLKNMPSEFSANEVAAISNAVKFSVALGFSIAYFAVGALTQRRSWFNFEFLGDKNKSLAWVLVSTLLVFSAVTGVVIRSNEKWQGKVIGAATSLVMILGFEFVLWESIWKVVTKIQSFKGGPLAAMLLLIGALVSVAISITRNRYSKSKVRIQYARMLFFFAWIYVLVGCTAAAGSDRSQIWSGGKTAKSFWSSARREDLRNVSIATAITLLVVSGFVVAFTIVRERYKLEELSRRLIWASTELESSTDAEKRLQLAAVQWIGTAAVIARLFRYPLGTTIIGTAGIEIAGQENFQVLKFDRQRLELTRKGEQGLTARVRQLFVAKNWLGRQYRQLISRFQEDLAFEQGLDKSNDVVQRPENCSAVPSFEEVDSGQARGSRWTFMNHVFNGLYDDVLLETTNEVQLEAAYSTIVDDSDSHSVGGTKLIAPQFFGRLIPEEGPLLPAGLVTKLFTGSDKQQVMTPYIWWPDELLARPGVGQQVQFKSSSVLSPEKITDPIRILGSCVLISVPFILEDVREGEKSV